MSGRQSMEAIYTLMDRCFEEFTLDEKECVLESYLEMYETDHCSLCCAQLTSSGYDTEGRAHCPECDGATREQNIDHAKDAMFDNLNDIGFDVESTAPLAEALTLLMHVRYQDAPGEGLKTHLAISRCGLSDETCRELYEQELADGGAA